MKFKLLPTAAALVAVFSAASASAEVINADLQKQVEDKQPIVLTPETVVPEGIVFSGYARYGAHYSDDLYEFVSAEGQLAGNAAGRLGNEGNGGEFQFAKGFQSDDGAIWDVVVMLEHWGDEIGLKKFYAGVTNIFESQPNAYLWAGRDFHQRYQHALNDHYWMTHDGQGAGIYNLEFGGLKFDISAVAQVEGSSPADSGNYAVTSKLHGMDFSDSLSLSLLANYGFASDQYDENGNKTDVENDTAYQVAAVLDNTWSKGSNQFVVRYSDNSDASVFTKTADQTAIYTGLTGSVNFSENVVVEYLGAYHNLSNAQDNSQDRTNYSAIVRPMYNWNSVHSTWLEAGYSLVDYDNDAENSAWKVTLSQNISINAFDGARPMLRFYAMVGEADNQVTSTSYEAKQDTFALGAMFESWW
ncbi:carbohydrate porin [Psychromonas ossibalaenae]|uniref:carbohydrate porin n=1 Tax=Psychromonas ossibalaenae TaxID=444922 RepID=UPI0003723749|nr:carbohydrate porin [Psychromonas ossibalaenae]